MLYKHNQLVNVKLNTTGLTYPGLIDEPLDNERYSVYIYKFRRYFEVDESQITERES